MSTLNLKTICKSQDSAKPWFKLEEFEIYCPICQAILVATNIEEVELGYHEGYIFAHRDLPHYSEDLTALRIGIQ